MVVEDGIIDGNSITFVVSGAVSKESVSLLLLLIGYADRAGFAVKVDVERVEGVHADAVRDLRALETRGIRFLRKRPLPIYVDRVRTSLN